MSPERIARGVDRAGALVRARYLEGARAIAPIGVAAFAFALSFGVLARTAGMGWVAPIVDVGDDVRRLGAVRGRVDPAGRRRGGGRDPAPR